MLQRQIVAPVTTSFINNNIVIKSQEEHQGTGATSTRVENHLSYALF